MKRHERYDILCSLSAPGIDYTRISKQVNKQQQEGLTAAKEGCDSSNWGV